MGGDPTIYLGIFITNYRVFIYKMGHTYNLLEEECKCQHQNVEKFQHENA